MSLLAPQVGDSTNLLLKKLVTATQALAEGAGVFLTEAEADALYFRLDASNGPITGQVVVNQSGGTAPAPFNTNGLQIVGPAAGQTTVELDSFANNNRLLFRRANGTVGVPSAVLVGESLAGISFGGYGTSQYVSAFAGYGAFAEETFTNTACGIKLTAGVVLTGTTTAYTVWDATGAGRLIVGSGGAKSIPAWGVLGAILSVSNSVGAGFIVTDNSTAASGTAASAVFSSFAQPTLAATNSSVTTTDVANVYIAGPVIVGANQTLTRNYSLWIPSGQVRFDGAFVTNRLVNPRTSGGTETTRESFGITTNEGAGARVDRTLPGAVSGLQYTYVVQDADGIRVIAAAGDTIRMAGTVSSAGGSITSTTIGDSVTLVAINATEWVAMCYVGTPAGSWTFI